MSGIYKFAWSGGAVLLSVMLALGVMAPQRVSAVATSSNVTTTVALSTNATSGSGAYTTLPPVVFTLSAVGDLLVGSVVTLTAPAGWTFDPAATPTVSKTGAIALASITATDTTTTVTLPAVTTVHTSADTVTVTGIPIRPVSASRGGGTVTSASSTGTFGTPVAATLVLNAGPGTAASNNIPPNGGFGFIVFNGGTLAQLVAATGCPASTMALWVTANSDFVTYVPGTSISVVNAAFLALFPNSLVSAGTAFLGKC